MKALLTGGTGFTGSHVARELLRRGYHFEALVRDPENAAELKSLGIVCHKGNLEDAEGFKKLLQNFDVLIHVASLGFGTGPSIAQCVQQSGVKRAVFVSTTAIFTRLPAPTKAIRVTAERAIECTDVNYTILRPTMIYGTPRDRNIIRLLKYIKVFPLVPVLGSGTYLQQPVHVDDVAWAICEVIENPSTFRQAFNIGGGRALTFREVVKLAGESVHRRPLLIPIPLRLALLVVRFARRILGKRFPITKEQVLRLNEDKAFDLGPAHRAFGYTPRDFAVGVQIEAKILGDQTS